MGQSNSEFLKMIRSLTALTQASGSMSGLNISSIMSSSESNEDDNSRNSSKGSSLQSEWQKISERIKYRHEYGIGNVYIKYYFHVRHF